MWARARSYICTAGIATTASPKTWKQKMQLFVMWSWVERFKYLGDSTWNNWSCFGIGPRSFAWIVLGRLRRAKGWREIIGSSIPGETSSFQVFFCWIGKDIPLPSVSWFCHAGELDSKCKHTLSANDIALLILTVNLKQIVRLKNKKKGTFWKLGSPGSYVASQETRNPLDCGFWGSSKATHNQNWPPSSESVQFAIWINSLIVFVIHIKYIH